MGLWWCSSSSRTCSRVCPNPSFPCFLATACRKKPSDFCSRPPSSPWWTRLGVTPHLALTFPPFPSPPPPPPRPQSLPVLVCPNLEPPTLPSSLCPRIPNACPPFGLNPPLLPPLISPSFRPHPHASREPPIPTTRPLSPSLIQRLIGSSDILGRERRIWWDTWVTHTAPRAPDMVGHVGHAYGISNPGYGGSRGSCIWVRER